MSTSSEARKAGAPGSAVEHVNALTKRWLAAAGSDARVLWRWLSPRRWPLMPT